MKGDYLPWMVNGKKEISKWKCWSLIEADSDLNILSSSSKFYPNPHGLLGLKSIICTSL